MKNVLLASPLSDKSIVSGTLAMGNNSIINIQNKNLAIVYRTEKTCFIKLSFEVPETIDFISLISHNGFGTLSLKASNDASYDNIIIDSLPLITGAALERKFNNFAKLFSPVSYKNWLIEINNDDFDIDYFQVGRIYLSKAFIPKVNISYGFEEGLSTRGSSQRTISGGLTTQRKEPLRTIKFTLDFLNENEVYGDIWEMEQSRGTSEDIICIPNIDDNKYLQKRFLYARFKSILPLSLPNFNTYKKSFEIEEIK